jgi:hypothetical protein
LIRAWAARDPYTALVPLKKLSEAELRGIAEVVSELAASRGQSFDARTTGIDFTRAALKDATFKARLAEAHWRLLAHQASGVRRERLQPLAPLFQDLEREAEAVLRGSKSSATLEALTWLRNLQ